MGDAEGPRSPATIDMDGAEPSRHGFMTWLALRKARRNGAEEGAEGGAGAEPGLEVTRPGLSNLQRMKVVDVAVPMVEIVAADVTISKDALLELFRESGFSRLPVYEGTLDEPLGMVHLKDFALRYGFSRQTDEFDVRGMLRPVLYAPPSMPIGVLLQKMQTERCHMALVIDEYGGTDGLVTIEDLIEQVIGEIEDEHDVEEADPWRQVAPGVYVMRARAPLEDFEQEIGRSLTGSDFDEDVDTMGGLVFLLTGRVPARGEVVPYPEGGVEFQILDADPRRIKRMRVRLLDNAATNG